MALRCKKCGKVTRDKLQTTLKNFLKKQCCRGCKSTQFTEIDTVSFDFCSLVFISDFDDSQSSFFSDSEGMRIPHEIDTHKSTLHEYVAPRICEEPITHHSNFDSHSHTHYDHHSSFSDNSSSYDSSFSCDSSSCDCGSSCD